MQVYYIEVMIDRGENLPILNSPPKSPDVLQLPSPDIRKVNVKQDHIISLQPGQTVDSLENKNHLLFNTGHSSQMYQKGVRCVSDDDIYDVVSTENTETSRVIKLNIESLVHNPTYAGDITRQKVLLEFIAAELNQSLLSYFNSYPDDLRELESQKDKISNETYEEQKKHLAQGLDFLKSLPQEQIDNLKEQHQSVLHFLEASAKQGVRLDDLPLYGNITSTLRAHELLFAKLGSGGI